MSNIKTKDIPFNERYVYLALNGDFLAESVTHNLRCLYEFIDKCTPGGNTWKYGNAYRVILYEARKLAGYRKNIISKRQVCSLIRTIENKDVTVVKIPYSCDYIFRAIFSIFERYKKDASISVPPEIEAFYSQLRRTVFYSKQSEQYEYKFTHNILENKENLRKIRVALLNDLCSDECALGRDF